jgi:hypothetical protein
MNLIEMQKGIGIMLGRNKKMTERITSDHYELVFDGNQIPRELVETFIVPGYRPTLGEITECAMKSYVSDKVGGGIPEETTKEEYVKDSIDFTARDSRTYCEHQYIGSSKHLTPQINIPTSLLYGLETVEEINKQRRQKLGAGQLKRLADIPLTGFENMAFPGLIIGRNAFKKNGVDFVNVDWGLANEETEEVQPQIEIHYKDGRVENLIGEMPKVIEKTSYWDINGALTNLQRMIEREGSSNADSTYLQFLQACYHNTQRVFEEHSGIFRFADRQRLQIVHYLSGGKVVDLKLEAKK